MFFKASLQQLYLEDERPWLVGFSGGKDSIRQPTDWRRLFLMLSYPFPAEQRKKPMSVLCADTRVEPPGAIAKMIEGMLRSMRECSQHNRLNIEVNLFKPMFASSYWVNITGGNAEKRDGQD